MNRNQVVLYICNIEDTDTDYLFQKYGLYFDKERLLRISSSKNEKIRAKGIATGAYLVKILEDYNLNLSDVSYGEHGKPFIVNNESIHFNLSHSGKYMALAIAGQPVGVDIQKKVPYNDKVVDKIASSEDAKVIREHFQDRFNYIWSLKEACAKLCGDGLVNGMSRFSMDYSLKNPRVFCKDQPYGFIKEVDYEADYAISLACKEEFEIVKTEVLEEVL